MIPRRLLRGLAWLVAHTLYRLRLRDIRRHVPARGAALVAIHKLLKKKLTGGRERRSVNLADCVSG